MPAGIKRSPFVRPMADALGWSLGKLRDLFNRSDYHAPYLDLQRALRILQAQAPAQVPNVLKALNLDATVLQSGSPEGGQQLALMAPSAPPSHTPEAPSGAVITHLRPRPSGTKIPLVDRLAKTLPGEEGMTLKREKVRAVLKRHNADGRFKDEERAFAWIKKAFPEASPLVLHGMGVSVEVAPDIDNLPPTRLRELVRSLMSDSGGKDQQLKLISAQLGEVNYMLKAAKKKLREETGLDEADEFLGFFHLAMAASKKRI